MKQKKKNIIYKRRGFTLIELLVVISIIALLMAILIPALRAAKEMAAGSACISNQHALATAWFSYTINNDGKLVDGDTENEDSWVNRPTNKSGTRLTMVTGYTLEDEKRGIERGLLFPYVKDVRAYHCPADKRYRKPPTETDTSVTNAETGGFRTYAITGCMNGECRTNDDGNERKYNIEIYAQIKSPSDKCVLVEENDPRGYNHKSWVISSPDNLTVFNWTDRLAVWHNKKSTLGWADGHATVQRWVDKRTTLAVRVRSWDDWKDGNAALGFSGRMGQTDNQDIIFMKKHYPHIGHWTGD